MKTSSRAMRFIAAILSLALMHGAFAPQAWARVVSVGALSTPVGGSATAASVNLTSPANSETPFLSPSNAGLTVSFSAHSLAPVAIQPPLAVDAAAVTPNALSAHASAVPAAPAPAPAVVSVAASKDAAPNTVTVSEAAAITLEGGLRTGRIADKAAAIISGVRAFFGGKSVESVPAAHKSLVSGELSAARASDLKPGSAAHAGGAPTLRPQSGDNEPPAPPQQSNEPGKKGKGWFGLGAIVAALIGGKLVMQFGLEAQGAAIAPLTEDAFGDLSILAQVAIFMSIGSMIGQQLAQFLSGKFGLTKTFYGAQVLRAVSLATMVFLLGTGMMPLPLMFVFYALNGVVTGVALTAEGALRKFLLARQGVSQQKYLTWWQLLAEIIAVPAPMVLGALVLSVGAGWITALYPATILLGLMLFLMLKVIPLSTAKRIENMVEDAVKAAATAAPLAPAAPGAPKVGAWRKIKNAFKNIFNNMEEGKDFVFKNAALKYSLAGATIFDLMNLLIYRLITPGYGKLVAGSAGMAEVQGNLVGMFSLGGLLLAATFLILEKWNTKKNKGKSADELAAAERGSMLRWTMLAVPALGLLAVMAFNLALPFAPVMFMGVNWVPGTVLAAVLIPFGFIQVAAAIKLNSYFNDRLPSDSGKVQKALAFSGSAMTALSIVLMLALKPLFGDIAAFNPFPYLAAALVPLGAAVLFIQRKLAGATKLENLKIVEGAPGEKTAGGFVGVLLGVIAAALILSFMAFIPGMTGVLAGLGVLGKFALHLGVALALPAAGWYADRALRKRSAK